MQRFAQVFEQLFHSALNAVAPRVCAACDAQAGAQAFCRSCDAHFEQNASHQRLVTLGNLDIVTLGPFQPPLSDAIKRLKYSGRSDLAAPLADLWWQGCQSSFPETASTTLVPVPLHPRRLVARGYNQSALLASRLAKHTGQRLAPALLKKVRDTSAQVGLSALQRTQNLDGAFRTTHGAGRQFSRYLVLVDDVVTTGTTAAACARAAAEAGFQVTAVWALAHACTEKGTLA